MFLSHETSFWMAIIHKVKTDHTCKTDVQNFSRPPRGLWENTKYFFSYIVFHSNEMLNKLTREESPRGFEPETRGCDFSGVGAVQHPIPSAILGNGQTLTKIIPWVHQGLT